MRNFKNVFVITILSVAMNMFCSDNPNFNLKRNAKYNKGSISILKTGKQPISIKGEASTSANTSTQNGTGWGAVGSGLGGIIVEENIKKKNAQLLGEFYQSQIPLVNNIDLENIIETKLVQSINQGKMFKANIDNSILLPSFIEFTQNSMKYQSAEYLSKIDKAKKNIASDYFIEYNLYYFDIVNDGTSGIAHVYMRFEMTDRATGKHIWRYFSDLQENIAVPTSANKPQPSDLSMIFTRLANKAVDDAMHDFNSVVDK